MIALAFFAGILLAATIAILIVRGAKAPHVDEIDWFDCRAGLPPPMPRVKPARDVYSTYINRCDKCHTEKPVFWPCDVCREKDRCVLGADDRMRSLSVRKPCIACYGGDFPCVCQRDANFWDIANHEPEAGSVEYRFLDIPYQDEA